MNSIGKALFIVGPTATGKTKLALQILKVIPSVIISADSRQVYKGMDIGTGKDTPIDGTTIELLNEVFPNEEWNVSHFQKRSEELAKKAWNANKLPIFVGGTGLYLQTLVEEYATLDIPQNIALRKVLDKQDVLTLQKTLESADQERFLSMNNSDKNNSRRLIRAIEVADDLRAHKQTKRNSDHMFSDVLWIGLSGELRDLENRIRTRVEDRIHAGMIQEVEQLIKNYPSWNFPAFSATGYAEIRSYLKGKISKEGTLNLWTLHEIQYAKRQITWFKKRLNIYWFEANDPHVHARVEKRLRSWYYGEYESKN